LIDCDVKIHIVISHYVQTVFYSLMSGVGLIIEVNRHRARLLLGWVTVCVRVNHLGM